MLNGISAVGKKAVVYVSFAVRIGKHCANFSAFILPLLKDMLWLEGVTFPFSPGCFLSLGNQYSHLWVVCQEFFIFFSINLKSPQNPLSENLLKSLFHVENGFGNTLILTDVGMQVFIRSSGATWLLWPLTSCAGKGIFSSSRSTIPELKCDDGSKLWIRISLSLHTADSNISCPFLWSWYYGIEWMVLQ